MNNVLDRIDKALSFKSMLVTLIVFVMMLQFCPIGASATALDELGREAPVIVSLGDSFSSGEGIEPFYDQNLSNEEKVKSEDWLAHRSQQSWPGQLRVPGLSGLTRDHKQYGKNWFFVASSGAETKHLNDVKQKKEYAIGMFGGVSGEKELPKQIDVFKKLTYGSVDYVTLTLGGNDAKFTQIITEAVTGSTYLNTSKLSQKLSEVWTKFYKKGGIRDDLYDSYKLIEEKAGPQAQIIVAGYPRLLDETGKGTWFSKEEAEMINQAVSDFNKEIEKIVNQCAAEGMKICFVSVEGAFKDHGACSSDPYINGVYLLESKPQELKNFVKASSYSIHPNAKGACAYAECVNKKIQELAEEEEKRLEQEAFNPIPQDREIVLVLDTSGSMGGTPISETKEASYKFVNTVLASQTNVGIVCYDSYAEIASPITGSKKYLDKVIQGVGAGGNTNIEAGLRAADGMLSASKAKKKIIVLMSDGMPNEGLVDQELIDYAGTLKEKGYYIYTLGFFSALSDKMGAYELMGKMASSGCHFEVDKAEDLVFFFGDIADQISGENYIYVRIACPVDVTVTYNGETLTSKGNETSQRVSFGSMTFEEAAEEEDENGETTDNAWADDDENGLWADNNDYAGGYDSDDNDIRDEEEAEDEGEDTRVKILRLKEGVDYDIEIEGNGSGKMTYTIGFVDEDGEYSDMRTFANIKINKKTEIHTVAAVSAETFMYVDQDGDGEYDLTYRALENSRAKRIEAVEIPYVEIAIVAVAILAVAILAVVLTRHFKIKRYL